MLKTFETSDTSIEPAIVENIEVSEELIGVTSECRRVSAEKGRTLLEDEDNEFKDLNNAKDVDEMNQSMLVKCQYIRSSGLSSLHDCGISLLLGILTAIEATMLKTIHTSQDANNWNKRKLCMVFLLLFMVVLGSVREH